MSVQIRKAYHSLRVHDLFKDLPKLLRSLSLALWSG